MPKNVLFRIMPLIFSAILALSGCKVFSVGKELRPFMKEQVKIPYDLTVVQSREVMASEQIDRPFSRTLVIYYDSTECTSCHISHLGGLRFLYEFSDSLDVNIMVIFDPGLGAGWETIIDLQEADFPYPVYVDEVGSFKKQNPFLAENKLFHSFMIDYEGRPIYIGNPAAGGDMWDLFLEALDNNKRRRIVHN